MVFAKKMQDKIPHLWQLLRVPMDAYQDVMVGPQHQGTTADRVAHFCTRTGPCAVGAAAARGRWQPWGWCCASSPQIMDTTTVNIDDHLSVAGVVDITHVEAQERFPDLPPRQGWAAPPPAA
jgi:hypothetical protein